MVSRKQQQIIEAELFRKRLARRRWLAGAVVLLVVLGLGWQAGEWLDGNLRKVEIEGDLSAIERDAVTAVIAQTLGQAPGANDPESLTAGLHSLSLPKVLEAVAGLSWVDQVSARRRWPDTVIVRLTRHSVVARWGGGGFVATNGEVIQSELGEGLADNTSVDGNFDLPLLHCERAGSARAMSVFSMLNSGVLRADLKLVSLHESELGEWTAGIRLSGTGRTLDVVLGRDDLVARLQRFVAVHSQALRPQLARVAAVDARYHNGVAVRWKPAARLLDSSAGEI